MWFYYKGVAVLSTVRPPLNSWGEGSLPASTQYISKTTYVCGCLASLAVAQEMNVLSSGYPKVNISLIFKKQGRFS